MPIYGRCTKRLTNPKPKANPKQQTLKRGNIAPAWNSNLQLKRRNPVIYVDPFRSKITPYSPITPPNFKFRLQTFHLNVYNLLKDENVIFRRPSAGITNIQVPVLLCAAVYRKIREIMNRTDNWGEDISVPEDRRLTLRENFNATFTPEENMEEEAPPTENVVAEEPVVEEESDGNMNDDSMEPPPFQRIDLDDETLFEHDVDVLEISNDDIFEGEESYDNIVDDSMESFDERADMDDEDFIEHDVIEISDDDDDTPQEEEEGDLYEYLNMESDDNMDYESMATDQNDDGPIVHGGDVPENSNEEYDDYTEYEDSDSYEYIGEEYDSDFEGSVEDSEEEITDKETEEE